MFGFTIGVREKDLTVAIIKFIDPNTINLKKKSNIVVDGFGWVINVIYFFDHFLRKKQKEIKK